MLPHMAFASFVLVLPVGYYPENPDSTIFIIGVHGGYGQGASVIRDCSGRALHAEGSSYFDVSGSAYITVPPGSRSPFLMGLRGGYWKSKAAYATSHSSGYPEYIYTYGRSPEYTISFSYFNPSINYETRYIGMGIGYMSANIPFLFEDLLDRECERPDDIPISAHLRLGNLDKLHFATSFAENTPLISGGSFIDIGVGYPSGHYTRMFSGLSVGFYDQIGFVQQIRFKLNRTLDTDITVRLGEAGGVFEGSLSSGLTYRFGAIRR